MRLLEGRGPCWPKHTFEIPWHKHQLPPFSIKWYCKRSSAFVAPESHQAQMRHTLWKSIFVCTFVRFPHLVCLVCLDNGKNLSRCLCPGSRPIFCLACNSPLTDSQAVASWKFVAKVSVLLWLVTINQIDLKVLVQHLIQRGAPLQSDDHVSRQSVC